MQFTPDDIRLFLTLAGWKRAAEKDTSVWEIWVDQYRNEVGVMLDPKDPDYNDFLWGVIDFVLGTLTMPAYRKKWELLINFGKELEKAKHGHV